MKYRFPLANGKSLVIEGETVPTDEEVISVAQEAGVRTLLMNPKETPEPEQPGFMEGLTGQANTKITLGDVMEQGPGVFKKMLTPQYAGEVTRDVGALAAGKVGPKAVQGTLRTVGRTMEQHGRPIATIGGFAGGAAIGHPWIGMGTGKTLGPVVEGMGRGLRKIGTPARPEQTPMTDVLRNESLDPSRFQGPQPPPQPATQSVHSTQTTRLQKQGFDMTPEQSVGRLRSVSPDIAGKQWDQQAFNNLIAKVGLKAALEQYGIGQYGTDPFKIP